MPVLSPHHTSSSYRSAFNSSIDRPFYNSSSYTPRISNYSERFSTRSYIDSEGRRTFSRSGSITEDGVTSRFKEELRDGSVRRDSISKESSNYDYRDGSLSRERGARLSSVGVIDDLTELRNKYSPNNYVPAIHRKNDNMGRSKSINDIGLPPIEKIANSRKKVNTATATATTTTAATTETFNANNMSVLPGSTNDNNSNNDDNGNRATVADLRKKFDKNASTDNRISIKIEPNHTTEHVKLSNNKFKILDQETNKTKINSKIKKIEPTAEKSKIPGIHSTDDSNHKTSLSIRKSLLDKTKKIDKPKIKPVTTTSVVTIAKVPEIEQNKYFTTDGDSENNEIGKNSKQNGLVTPNAKTGLHSMKENGIESSKENSISDGEHGDSGAAPKTTIINVVFESEHLECVEKSPARDLETSTSPKLNKNRISPSNNGATTTASNLLNSNSLGRKSIERERRSVNSIASGAAFDDDIYDRSAGLGYRLGTGSPTSVIKTLGLNGLKNIGNTCFMNSVIQCLSNTKQLLEYLRHDDYVKDINQSNSSMKGSLIKAFAEVIKELWADDACDRVINTVSLKSQIQRFAPRFMGYAQQDAQEFLRYLLEGLHEDVNRVVEKPTPIHTEIDDRLDDVAKSAESWNRYLRMDNSKIVDIFVGQLKSTLKCTFCGHSSVTFDPFWDLSLPIPTRSGPLRLSQCLESFTREETLDGDEKPTCSKCKERRKCTKSFSIQKFPKILVIHLKRFSPTERFRGKLNVTVDFPLENLDMSKYAADGVTSSRYNLYAVSNHSGTTYSGHYTAYCRHPYAMTWHEYNDSRVSTVSSRSVVSSEAYVLFYEQEGHRSHL